MEIYRKSMREALEETRAYRDPKNVTEIVGGQGHMTITQDDKVLIIKTKDWQVYKAKGWQKKESVEEEGHLSYDEWLKQVKGIEKGAYGITGDEHTKYSKEWKAYQKEELEEKLEVKWDKSKEGWYDKQGRRRYLGKGATMDLLKKQIDKAKATGDWSTFDIKKEFFDIEEVELDEAISPDKVKSYTRSNDHFGARIYIAQQMRDKDMELIYQSLETMHRKYGNTVGNSAVQLRDKIEKLLYGKIVGKWGTKAGDKIIKEL
jgi:hypothetical protein